jgi:hypothetical protein
MAAQKKRLSLYDFRDIDLMLKLEEQGDGEGWVSSSALAGSLGMSDDIQSVAQRCSWMRRFGFFEFDDEKKMWRLSSGGRRVADAKLKAATATSIDKVPDEAMVDVMAHVTTRFRLGDPMLANMLRREFDFGTNPRSTIWNGRR